MVVSIISPMAAAILKMTAMLEKIQLAPYLKALSHLDDLASVCRLMKIFFKTLAHVEYVMGKFCIR